MQTYTWFYSLKDQPSPAQKAKLEAGFEQFLANWKSHGTPVEGLIQFVYDRFVIIQSDPGKARPSGCSIDSLKRGVEGILTQTELPWMEAAYVCYRDAAGEIQSVHFSKIKSLIESGELTADTQVFDHSLSQSDDLSKWEQPLSATWLKRFLHERV